MTFTLPPLGHREVMLSIRRGRIVGAVILSLLGWAQGGCVRSITRIANQEAAVQDVRVVRTYILCPFTTYDIGTLDYSNRLIRGQQMLPLRPNLHVQCGDSGGRDNRCILRGGDVQVDGTSHWGLAPATLSNVVIRGVTFENVTRYNVWIKTPGDVYFVDCEFRGMDQALTPILLDYANVGSGQQLRVTFFGCLFANNTYRGMPSQPALVVANSHQNSLVFRNNQFFNNDMVHNKTTLSPRVSSLIEASGPLTLIGNCFQNNRVRVSPVVTYYGKYMLSNNAGDASTRGLVVCPFMSVMATAAQYNALAPTCLNFDRTTCPLLPVVAWNSTWDWRLSETLDTRAPRPAAIVSPRPASSFRPSVGSTVGGSSSTSGTSTTWSPSPTRTVQPTSTSTRPTGLWPAEESTFPSVVPSNFPSSVPSIGAASASPSTSWGVSPAPESVPEPAGPTRRGSYPTVIRSAGSSIAPEHIGTTRPPTAITRGPTSRSPGNLAVNSVHPVSSGTWTAVLASGAATSCGAAVVWTVLAGVITGLAMKIS